MATNNIFDIRDIQKFDVISIDCNVVLPLIFNVSSNEILEEMQRIGITYLNQDDLKRMFINIFLIKGREFTTQDDCYGNKTYYKKDDLLFIKKKNSCSIMLNNSAKKKWRESRIQEPLPYILGPKTKNSYKILDIRLIKDFEVWIVGYYNCTYKTNNKDIIEEMNLGKIQSLRSNVFYKNLAKTIFCKAVLADYYYLLAAGTKEHDLQGINFYKKSIGPQEMRRVKLEVLNTKKRSTRRRIDFSRS
jgi:hypothetical protein